MRFWKTESEDAFLILKSFEKLRAAVAAVALTF